MLNIILIVLVFVIAVIGYMVVRYLAKMTWFIGAMESHSMQRLAIDARREGGKVTWQDTGGKLDVNVSFKPPMARRSKKPWFW